MALRIWEWLRWWWRVLGGRHRTRQRSAGSRRLQRQCKDDRWSGV